MIVQKIFIRHDRYISPEERVTPCFEMEQYNVLFDHISDSFLPWLRDALVVNVFFEDVNRYPDEKENAKKIYDYCNQHGISVATCRWELKDII